MTWNASEVPAPGQSVFFVDRSGNYYASRVVSVGEYGWITLRREDTQECYTVPHFSSTRRYGRMWANTFELDPALQVARLRAKISSDT